MNNAPAGGHGAPDAQVQPGRDDHAIFPESQLGAMAAQADSNHRFVTSADTYRHMVANGWVGEGVAFSSPES